MFVSVSVCVCVTISNEKRDHESERQQGGVYSRVWREEKEVGSNVIIL